MFWIHVPVYTIIKYLQNIKSSCPAYSIFYEIDFMHFLHVHMYFARIYLLYICNKWNCMHYTLKSYCRSGGNNCSSYFIASCQLPKLLSLWCILWAYRHILTKQITFPETALKVRMLMMIAVWVQYIDLTLFSTFKSNNISIIKK